MWDQYEKSMATWLYCISNASITHPVFTPYLMQNCLTTLEASTFLEKVLFIQRKFTHFNSLPSDLLHDIDMCHLGIVHHNNIKPVLA